MAEIFPVDSYNAEEPEVTLGYTLTQYIDFCGADILLLQETLRTGRYPLTIPTNVIEETINLAKQEFAELLALDPDTTSRGALNEVLQKYRQRMNALMPDTE